MTESEWLVCAESVAMLKGAGDRLSERKLRLFAVACCRRVARLLTPEALAALEVPERFAEGKATAAERKGARAAAFGAGWVGPPDFPREQVMHARGPAKEAVCSSLSRKPAEAALRAAGASSSRRCSSPGTPSGWPRRPPAGARRRSSRRCCTGRKVAPPAPAPPSGRPRPSCSAASPATRSGP